MVTTILTILSFLGVNIAIAGWAGNLAEIRRQTLFRRDQILQDLRPGIAERAVRSDWSSGEEIAKFWSAIPDARKQRLVILAGMSQNLAINDRQPGDQTIVEWMDDLLSARGVRAFGLSAPNLCHEEAFLTLLALARDEVHRPAGYVWGVCFDKFRNVDLRPGYRELLLSRPGLLAAWTDLANREASRYPEAAAKMKQSAAAATATAKVREATLEDRIRDGVGRFVPVIAARGEINGWAQMGLFMTRNAVLRIKTSSKRPMIAGRYAMNQQFLELLLDVAAEAGVAVALYNIPLNPLAENPYAPEEYASFKAWIAGLAARRQIPYANLEGLVPADEWGLLMGQPDYKHFRGPAHRRTAGAIVDVFGSALVPPGPRA